MPEIDRSDIRRLSALLKEIDSLPRDARDATFRTWRTKTGMVLAKVFGENSALRSRFSALLWENFGFDIGTDENERRFDRAREGARKILAEAIETANFLGQQDSYASHESAGDKQVEDNSGHKKPTHLTDLSPVGVLKAAIDAVPAVRYALGVGGIAAVVAIVVVWWKLDIGLAVIGTLIAIIFMVVLVIFAALAGLGTPALTPLALLLAWAFVVLTIFAAALFVSCAFFDWPKTLPCLLRGECAQRGSATAVFPGTTGSSQKVWFIIETVEAFGELARPGLGIRLNIDVNGIKHRYPSLAGVEWVGIGPDSAPQQFRVPDSQSYEIQMTGEILRDGEVLDLVSQENPQVRVGKRPVSRRYRLFTKNPAGVHASQVGLEVTYRIASTSD